MGNNVNELERNDEADLEQKIGNEASGYGAVCGAVEPSRRVSLHRFGGSPILARDREPILQARRTEALQRQVNE